MFPQGCERACGRIRKLLLAHALEVQSLLRLWYGAVAVAVLETAIAKPRVVATAGVAFLAVVVEAAFAAAAENAISAGQ